MTEKIITLKQAPVVLVEMPFKTRFSITTKDVAEGSTGIRYRTEEDSCVKVIPFRPVKKLGYLSDLTEDQFAECVCSEINSMRTKVIYKNYSGSPVWFFTAKESFHSLLQSENVYTENPLGEKPVESEFYWGFLHDLEKWQEAQSRTINPERTLVLIKAK